MEHWLCFEQDKNNCIQINYKVTFHFELTIHWKILIIRILPKKIPQITSNFCFLVYYYISFSVGLKLVSHCNCSIVEQKRKLACIPLTCCFCAIRFCFVDLSEASEMVVLFAYTSKYCQSSVCINLCERPWYYCYTKASNTDARVNWKGINWTLCKTAHLKTFFFGDREKGFCVYLSTSMVCESRNLLSQTKLQNRWFLNLGKITISVFFPCAVCCYALPLKLFGN